MGMNTDAVQRLYVAYFNRPADPVGLAVFEAMLPTDRVATQAELQVIAETYFSPSAEYAAATRACQMPRSSTPSIRISLVEMQSEAALLDRQAEHRRRNCCEYCVAVILQRTGTDRERNRGEDRRGQQLHY